MWCVSRSQGIWTKVGATSTKWTRIPGSLTHMDVSADGTVWGVNMYNQIFSANGAAPVKKVKQMKAKKPKRVVRKVVKAKKIKVAKKKVAKKVMKKKAPKAAKKTM